MTADVLSLRPGGGPVRPALSDEALLAACRTGDAAALGELFRRHHAAIHRLCTRLAGSTGEADDLVQRTFLTAWTDAARFRGQSSVRAWLLAIAANQARHARRGAGRRRSALQLLGRGTGAAGPAPDDEAARRELVDRLGEALAALPHELREAFVLCELEELPGVEAARLLGLRPGTLWRRLHDARRRLLPLLERGGP